MARVRHILAAAAAAALFGATIPLNKAWRFETLHPLLASGLLYAGSALGSGAILLARRAAGGGWGRGIRRQDRLLTAVSIAVGGGLAPVALQWGLRHSSATAGSLLGATESMFTAVIAWGVFRERFRPAVGLAVALILGGGVLIGLADPGREGTQASPWGPLLLTVAYLAWGVDNNLSRKLSDNDPLALTFVRGVVVGLGSTLTAALALGAPMPEAPMLGRLLLVGAFGYGLSISLLIYAMRGLGAAQAGAWFGAAPFFGAALALLLGEKAGWIMAAAAGLMAAGMAAMTWDDLRRQGGAAGGGGS